MNSNSIVQLYLNNQTSDNTKILAKHNNDDDIKNQNDSGEYSKFILYYTIKFHLYVDKQKDDQSQSASI